MKELIKIACTVRHETEKAILIIDGDRETWLPKSVIEVDKEGDGTVIVSVPEWLASKCGLL